MRGAIELEPDTPVKLVRKGIIRWVALIFQLILSIGFWQVRLTFSKTYKLDELGN